MELLGFIYDKPAEKISANGYPISRELLDKGYIQKNNSEGIPRWYVKPAKVWIYLEVDGVRKRYNIYENIMAIYPDRQRISVKLAQTVLAQIITGKIELYLVDGKNGKQPFLKMKEINVKKKRNLNDK